MSTTPGGFNQSVIDEFRANQGRVGGSFEGAPVLLLHTKGAKSGLERVHPAMYLDFEGRRFVFATKGGADTNPDWYHNLVAHPDVSLEVGAETLSAMAAPLQGAERDRVWAVQASRFPQFAAYEEKTERVIPVVELR
ncbi:MAG TPA: nitroreductase family deazaflavin-dependent oxidoreductase [Candidatus Acidoferrales bacterium]|nr:nitroreductase family deazaflavin-dependent oxidoreductase [Candidatus Acidoferrales bacterium]